MKIGPFSMGLNLKHKTLLGILGYTLSFMSFNERIFQPFMKIGPFSMGLNLKLKTLLGILVYTLYSLVFT